MEKKQLVGDGSKFLAVLRTLVLVYFAGAFIYVGITEEAIGFVVVGVIAALIWGVVFYNRCKTKFFYDEKGFEWQSMTGKTRIEYKDVRSFVLERGAVSTSRSYTVYYVVVLNDGTRKQPQVPCSQDNPAFRAFLSTMKEANPDIAVDVPLYRKNIFGEF